jgi:hypothetical protein
MWGRIADLSERSRKRVQAVGIEDPATSSTFP